MALTPCCQLCSNSQSLLRCSSCKVVRYCSKDHQVSDWPQHKSACSGIKKARTLMNHEEQKLRDQPDGDGFAPPNVFEEHVGFFWGLHHTRPYMRARYALVEAIVKVRTYDAVVAALDHVMDCLRLCRGDNMGVRDMAPAMLLRLGRDQECYDFVKWWATTRQRGNYDWGNMDEPYLDIKNADVLEPQQYLCRKYMSLAYLVSISLLKIKLLLAVRAGSGGVAGDGETELGKVVKVLKSHVHDLYQAVEEGNPHFWGALISPGRNLGARLDFFTFGGKEEMQMVLNRYYDAWKETPGAIEVVKAIRQKKDY
ncbi:hypothetical protein MMC22_001849 [Lobaria immixta]|nr:hypothetical protein [Lobaria immixta]